jgi:hypothetical protein
MNTWQASTLYSSGDLVKPATVPIITVPVLANPSFDLGNSGWDLTGNAIIQQGVHFDGAWACQLAGQLSAGGTSQTFLDCTPGNTASITAEAMYSGATETARLTLIFNWYDSSKTFISTHTADFHHLSNGWRQYSDSNVAPANAVFLKVGFGLQNVTTTTSIVDAFSVITGYSQPPFTLVYQATQPTPATSGATEPPWSTTVDTTFSDGGVTWLTVYPNRVKWEAQALMVSGPIEPVFPAAVGGTVLDGTMIWTAATQQITDKNCPNTKYVTIVSSKVYCADKDIIRYSATVNPLDWTTLGDAGYIPFGLQKFGSNPCVALGLYRSNLVAFNAEGFQMWQVNADPANISLITALPIGCTEQHSLLPIGNDLVFLSEKGVRTVSTAAASESLESGQTGEPVDSIFYDITQSEFLGVYRIDSAHDIGHGQYLLVINSEGV